MNVPYGTRLKNTSIDHLFVGSFLATNNDDLFNSLATLGIINSSGSDPALCYASKAITNSNATSTSHTHTHTTTTTSTQPQTTTLIPNTTTTIHSKNCTNAMARHASLFGIAIVVSCHYCLILVTAHKLPSLQYISPAFSSRCPL
mmetsp:Transcript_10069/g.21316  ORF Transcript_10069/g.21316 Transcript_10069/m.21316 type:complete len:145 (-) Transcript_10069:112-546(-)